MLIAFLPLLAQGLSQSPPPKPTWLVEEREKYCVAHLPRGADTGLLIEARPITDDLDLFFLVARGRGCRVATMGTLSIPDKDRQGPLYVSVTQPSGSQDQFVRVDFTDRQLAETARQGIISLRYGRSSVSVKTPGLVKVIPALKACQESVAKRLGIAATWSVPAREKRDFYNIIRNDDYPDRMISSGQEAVVSALLRIDASGGIADCKVYELGGHPGWEKDLCAIIRRRAHFAPALDAQGVPVESFYLTPRIRFILE